MAELKKGNRQKAENAILTMIEELAPGSPNTKFYKDMFASMKDAAFEDFMRGLKDKTKFLVIQQYNLGPKNISIENNLTLAKKWGHEFFEKVWMDGTNGMPAYLSNEKYLIVMMPLRRVAQILQKKTSIPEDNRSVDLVSGQPTGSSKGSKISYPELQILQARNLPNTVTELIKFRGGDNTAFNAMNDQIQKTGGASLEALSQLNTRTRSSVTLGTYLTSMHLDHTLPT